MTVSKGVVIAAAIASRDAYLATARTFYAARENDAAAAQYRRAGILNLLVEDESLCEAFAERIRILGADNG